MISDIKAMKDQVRLKIPPLFLLLYFLHTNSYYRSLFYHRIGPVWALLIGWWRPGNKYLYYQSRLKLALVYGWLIHIQQFLMPKA